MLTALMTFGGLAQAVIAVALVGACLAWIGCIIWGVML